MKTLIFLKKRKNRVWLTVSILLLCIIISIYFAIYEQKAINNFFEKIFNPDISKVLTLITPILVAIIVGFFINILSGDLHESIKEEIPKKDAPEQPKTLHDNDKIIDPDPFKIKQPETHPPSKPSPSHSTTLRQKTIR